MATTDTDIMDDPSLILSRTNDLFMTSLTFCVLLYYQWSRDGTSWVASLEDGTAEIRAHILKQVLIV